MDKKMEAAVRRGVEAALKDVLSGRFDDPIFSGTSDIEEATDMLHESLDQYFKSAHKALEEAASDISVLADDLRDNEHLFQFPGGQLGAEMSQLSELLDEILVKFEGLKNQYM